MRLTFLALLLIWLLAACNGSGSRPAVIAGGTLMDGTARPPVADSLLVVQDGLIVAMGAKGEVPVPKDATVFDAGGKYVFPLDPAHPLTLGGPADLVLARVNPALDPGYMKALAGRMENGRWVQFPGN